MTGFARSGSARLAFDAAGEGPPVLLLHAEVEDRRAWHHVVDDLAPRRRTVAYDRRGFGDTSFEAEPHSPVDDAVAVLDAAGTDGAVALVGCSAGGGLALDLALAHPERVDRLVLIASTCRGAPPGGGQVPESFREVGRAIEIARESGDLDTVNELEARLWLDGPAAPEHRVLGPVRELFLDMNGRALRAAPVGDERELPSAWDRLDRIAAPTLVLVGEFDLEDVGFTAEGLADRIPDARYEVLDDTAHLPHLEGHSRCRELLGAFLP